MRRTRTLDPNPRISLALTSVVSAWTVGAVYLLSTGRIQLPDAFVLVAMPWAALGAALHPDWLLLALIALPASVTAGVPATRLTVVVVLAWVMLLITRSAAPVGFGVGILVLVAIAVAGHLLEADVGPAAEAMNDAMMGLIGLYASLTLLAYHLAVLGEIDAERLARAFLLGVGSTLALGLAGYASAWFPAGPRIVTRSYLAYLAAGGFGIALAALTASGGPHRRIAGPVTTAALGVLVITSLTRAVWVAVAIMFVLLAYRSGRRRYVAIAIVGVVLSMTIPAARQELASSTRGDIAAAFETGAIATGRLELWTELWGRAEPALPWGNGFGFTWSLSSEELFGIEGVFSPGESEAIHPHNDFMYLLVEFGIPGVALLALFWVHALGAYLRVSRSTDERLRFGGRLLLGILVTGFLVALVDNLFAIRPYAERFFPAVGVLFGMARIERSRRGGVAIDSARGRSPSRTLAAST
jgi:O-Antigen ligase